MLVHRTTGESREVDPRVSRRGGTRGHQPNDVALAVTAHWMQHLAPAGLRSAPPVVEHIAFGRADRRSVETFAAAWSQPPADGL